MCADDELVRPLSAVLIYALSSLNLIYVNEPGELILIGILCRDPNISPLSAASD